MHWVTGDEDAIVPAEFPDLAADISKWLEGWKKGTCDVMTEAAREFGLPMIVGIDRQHFGAQGRETFNSAVLITPDGSWCEPDRL